MIKVTVQKLGNLYAPGLIQIDAPELGTSWITAITEEDMLRARGSIEDVILQCAEHFLNKKIKEPFLLNLVKGE